VSRYFRPILPFLISGSLCLTVVTARGMRCSKMAAAKSSWAVNNTDGYISRNLRNLSELQQTLSNLARSGSSHSKLDDSIVGLCWCLDDWYLVVYWQMLARICELQYDSMTHSGYNPCVMPLRVLHHSSLVTLYHWSINNKIILISLHVGDCNKARMM